MLVSSAPYCPLIKSGNEMELGTPQNDLFLFDSHFNTKPDKKNIKLFLPIVFAYDYSSNSVLYFYKNGDNLMSYNGSEIVQLLNRKQNHLDNNLAINYCFTDKSGNKWICTSAGVWKVSIQKNKFTHYFSASQLPQIAEGKRSIILNELKTYICAFKINKCTCFSLC